LNKKIRVAILTNIIPVYRAGFYDNIIQHPEVDVHVYCQSEIPHSSIKTVHERYASKARLLKARYFFNGKVVWQHFPWYKLLRGYDVIVADGNPRHLAQAVFSTIARLLGKKVVIWSTVHSHNNVVSREKIRIGWWRFFKHFMMYVHEDIDSLHNLGFKNHLIGALNNGLDQKKIDLAIEQWAGNELSNWQESQGITGKIILLSCARLEKGRFEDLANSLPKVIDQFPTVYWCLIGDGNGRDSLEALVTKLGINSHVQFLGAIHEESQLAPWFLSSHALVHTAPIGLSIMHAFGYGLPVITHNQTAEHGPEYSAFIPNLHGVNYKKGDVHHLTEVIINFLENTNVHQEMRQAVKYVTKEIHNVDIMAKRFVDFIKQVYSYKKN
jgi:glycosyltransferase involved in cell wall biosynthesis